MPVVEDIYLPQEPLINSSPLSFEYVNFIHAWSVLSREGGQQALDKIKDRPEGIKLASEGTEEISSSEKDEVEEILARKIVRGQWLYNVQWKAGGNTWEPVENLDNCAILLRKFM